MIVGIGSVRIVGQGSLDSAIQRIITKGKVAFIGFYFGHLVIGVVFVVGSIEIIFALRIF